MGDDLEQIVQRMIDAGESEANIATVIQGYQPASDIPDPSTFMPDMLTRMGVPEERPGGDFTQGGMPTPGKAALPFASKMAGRLLTKAPAATAAAGKGLEKIGRVAKPVTPLALGGALLTGDLSTATLAAAPYALRTAGRAIQKVGTKLSGAGKSAAPVAKLKLSAQQVAEMMRKEYGSAKAGQMLYGPARPGVTAAARKDAIKRLAPGASVLPQAAQRAIEKELSASTADEAFRYAAKAPNAPAQEYIGDMLRKSLLERMKRP